MLAVWLKPVEAFGDPRGVWVPVKPSNPITRIHVFGSTLDYTATIDWRCGQATCSTLQSLVESDSAPDASTFSVSLENVGPAPMLELRWQRGPPCNGAMSNENLLVAWGTMIASPTGASHFRTVGPPTCFAHMSASPPSMRPVRSKPPAAMHPTSVPASPRTPATKSRH